MPGPKHKGQKLEKVEEVRFAVLYVKIVQKFVSPDDWQRATQNPQKFFHAWLAKRHLKAMDSWGWQKEHQKGAPAKTFGLCKVHERDALTVLSASGAGCFINPSRSYPMPANKIEWLEQPDNEPIAAYVQRARDTGPDYGLVCGTKQVGRRVKRDADSPISRIWILEGVPRFWTTEQATHAAKQLFTDVEMIRQCKR